MKNLLFGAFFFVSTHAVTNAATVKVANPQQLRTALRGAEAGTRIEIAPGEYGNLSGENLVGNAQKPIEICASDAKNPPRFTSLHLSRLAYVEVSDLVIENSPANGLNVDDGGDYDKPSHHITLKNLHIRDIVPKGNYDGIKMSGIDNFRVENCTIERWGIGDGGGIDMVGCHDGVIENNTFRHNEATPENGLETGATGIQAKGGCRAVIIRGNRFEHAGVRSINCGGSTGLEFFRPSLKSYAADAPRYEAKDITIENNVFIGSDAAIAFVGVDGAVARRNTIYKPRKWAMRILQETKAPGFVPSRNVIFAENLVLFSNENWSEGGVNIGSQTAPETFRFERNAWFSLDNANRSKPNLPTPEKDGIYGQNPQFIDETKLDLRLQPNSPLRDKMGATPQKPAEK